MKSTSSFEDFWYSSIQVLQAGESEQCSGRPKNSVGNEPAPQRPEAPSAKLWKDSWTEQHKAQQNSERTGPQPQARGALASGHIPPVRNWLRQRVQHGEEAGTRQFVVQ